MAVTPDMIAVALGVDAPSPASPTAQQWEMWISDAVMLIEARAALLGITDPIDAARLDYVVREAVVAQVRRPDDATQVSVSVDDGSVSRTYRSSKGRIEILDEWWALLGLTPSTGAFSLELVPSSVQHLAWCSYSLGALYCSCGADIAGFPIYELG